MGAEASASPLGARLRSAGLWFFSPVGLALAAAFSSTFATTFFSATTSLTCGLAGVCSLTAAFASLASSTAHKDSFQAGAVL